MTKQLPKVFLRCRKHGQKTKKKRTRKGKRDHSLQRVKIIIVITVFHGCRLVGTILSGESRSSSSSQFSMAAGWLLCAGEDERDWSCGPAHATPSGFGALIADVTSPSTRRSKQSKGLRVGF
jgi:hypothetical protein